MTLRNLLLSAVLSASVPVLAQLVEKAPAPTAKPAARTSKIAKAPAGAKKLERKLSDAGITPRALGAWKQSGGKETLALRVVSFERLTPGGRGGAFNYGSPSNSVFVADGMELPVFQVQARDAFAEANSSQPLGLLRLTKKGSELSIDRGTTWVAAEQDGEKRIYAFDNLLVTFTPMDETFTPTRFQAIAFERGAVTKTKKQASYDGSTYPFFNSIVMAIAYGKNQIDGIIKYPGASFVVAFSGVKFGEKWIARSHANQPFNAFIKLNIGPLHEHGLTELRTSDQKFTQIELDSSHLMLGTGEFINYALTTEPAERLETAIEFDLTKGRELPELANAYKSNFGKSLWTKSDENPSFSRDAEAGYFKAGLKVWLWAPFRTQDRFYKDWEQKGQNCLQPFVTRIKAAGGSVGFLDAAGGGDSPGANGSLDSMGDSSSTSSYSNKQKEMEKILGNYFMGGISSDGGVLATSQLFQSKVFLGSPENGQAVKEVKTATPFSLIQPLPGGAGFIGMTPEGLRLLGTDGKLIRTYPGEKNFQVKAIKLSQEGDRVIAVGTDMKVRVWALATGALEHVFPEKSSTEFFIGGPKPGYFELTCSACANGRLYSGMGDGSVIVYEVQTGKKLKRVSDLCESKPLGIHLLPDGKSLLVIGTGGGLTILDADSWKIIRKMQTGNSPALAWAVDPKGKTIAIGTQKGKVAIVDTSSGATVAEFSLPESPITLLGSAPNGAWVAMNLKGGVFRLEGNSTFAIEGWNQLAGSKNN
jgi:hypothetical protein